MEEGEGEEERKERKEEGLPPLPRWEAALPVQFPSRPLRPRCGSCWSLKKVKVSEMKAVEEEGEKEEAEVLYPSRTHFLPCPPLHFLLHPPPLPP